MTDSNDPIRAQFEADQQAAKTQEVERDEWAWNWRTRDGEADIAFNLSRTPVNHGVAAYWHAKAGFWNQAANLLGFLILALLVAGIITGIKVIW